MNPKEIVRRKNQEPFQPFRVHLADGRFYDVLHRELVIVGPEVVHIGIPLGDHPLLLCEQTEIVDLDTITKLEPLVLTHPVPQIELLGAREG